MARVKIRLGLVLLATAVLGLQCNNGYDGSLFPSFLTAVSFQRNAGDSFTHVSGEKFLFYTMYAGVANMDLVYVIQVLPDGTRRIAVYGASLIPVGSVINSPDVGAMRVQLDGSNHLTGMCILNFTAALSSSLSGANSALTSFGPCRDYFMVRNNASGNYCMISPTTYSGGITYFYSRTFLFSPLSYITGQSSDITAGGRNLILEAAGNDMSSNTCLVFRDADTNEGYLLTYNTDLPPGNVPLSNLVSIGRIVPGTAQVDANGQPIAQTYDGRLRRFSTGGWSNDETDTKDFRNYIIAYGQNNTMYLFNPVTLDILKTRAWWNLNGY